MGPMSTKKECIADAPNKINPNTVIIAGIPGLMGTKIELPVKKRSVIPVYAPNRLAATRVVIRRNVIKVVAGMIIIAISVFPAIASSINQSAIDERKKEKAVTKAIGCCFGKT